MMVKTNNKWIQMSDSAIVGQLGSYIKQLRLQQNKTQAQLAEVAGLNRWTISQIEKGESITLMTLIQILRALDSLHVLNGFEIPDEISPLEYAKLKKKKKRERASGRTTNTSNENELGW